MFGVEKVRGRSGEQRFLDADAMRPEVPALVEGADLRQCHAKLEKDDEDV